MLCQCELANTRSTQRYKVTYIHSCLLVITRPHMLNAWDNHGPSVCWIFLLLTVVLILKLFWSQACVHCVRWTKSWLLCYLKASANNVGVISHMVSVVYESYLRIYCKVNSDPYGKRATKPFFISNMCFCTSLQRWCCFFLGGGGSTEWTRFSKKHPYKETITLKNEVTLTCCIVSGSGKWNTSVCKSVFHTCLLSF